MTLLGALHVAVAGLGFLAIPIVVVSMNGPGIAALVSGEPGSFFLLSGIAAFVSAMIVAVSLPSLVAGIGLLRHRPWSPAGAAIASVANLVNPPFGPLLAVYTLWVLFRTDAR